MLHGFGQGFGEPAAGLAERGQQFGEDRGQVGPAELKRDLIPAREAAQREFCVFPAGQLDLELLRRYLKTPPGGTRLRHLDALLGQPGCQRPADRGVEIAAAVTVVAQHAAAAKKYYFEAVWGNSQSPARS